MGKICGKVIKIKNEMAEIEINTNDGCGDCTGCTGCIKKNRTMIALNDKKAKLGDIVEVTTPEINIIPLAFFTLILPIIVFAALYLLLSSAGIVFKISLPLIASLFIVFLVIKSVSSPKNKKYNSYIERIL